MNSIKNKIWTSIALVGISFGMMNASYAGHGAGNGIILGGSVLASLLQKENVDLNCTAQIMDIGGSEKNVNVMIVNDVLSVFAQSKTASESFHFSDHVSIVSSHNYEYKLDTDNQENGYHLIANGNLFPSAAPDGSCTSLVSLTLLPISSSLQVVSGKFSCAAMCAQ